MRSATCLALYILTLASHSTSALFVYAHPDRPAPQTPPPSLANPAAQRDVAYRQAALASSTARPLQAAQAGYHARLAHRRQLNRRQDSPQDEESAGADGLPLFGTRTAEGGGAESTASAGDGDGDGSGGQGDGTHTETAPPATPTESVSHEWLTTSTLTPVSSAVPLAATMGLILPDPMQNIYVEQEYRLGFIDAVRKPAPTVGGWMRQVQPLLIVPGNKVNTFDMSGPRDPSDPLAIPPQSDGLCGARIEDDAVRYPFVFHSPGWYMLVINQTWYQPTITDNICALPYLTQNTFFATHLLSVRPLPTSGPMPPNPGPPHTVFAEVTLQTPGPLPIDPGEMDRAAKLGVGLGVALGVLALIGVVGMLWWFHRRNKRQREEEIFNRMKPHEQHAFILENPAHFLNPHRADYLRAQRGMYRGTDMFGQPRPWWSRWGHGTGIGSGYGADGIGVAAGQGQMYGGQMGQMGAGQGYMGQMGSMGYTGPGFGAGSAGAQPSYAALHPTAPAYGHGTANEQIPQTGANAHAPSGWKRFFAKGSGTGINSQQAYLYQQQQLRQQLLQQHQPHASLGGAHQPGQYGQPYAHNHDNEHDVSSKKAGYGYITAAEQEHYGQTAPIPQCGEFGQAYGQAQDMRQVYQVHQPQGQGQYGAGGQAGQAVMVYPTAAGQRWQ